MWPGAGGEWGGGGGVGAGGYQPSSVITRKGTGVGVTRKAMTLPSVKGKG